MITHVWSVTLSVSNLPRAVRFYEDVLGLQKKYQFDDYAGFECGGVEIGLRSWGEREPPRKGEPCIDLMVNDVGESYHLLNQRGASFVQEPKDTLWGGRIAVLVDPDGNTLQLTQVQWQKYFAVCARQ